MYLQKSKSNRREYITCEYTWNYDTAHTASPFQLREIQHVVIQGQATTPSEFIKQKVINPAREPDLIYVQWRKGLK